jgi:hypothetical protein
VTLDPALAHIDYRDVFYSDLRWTPVDAAQFVRQFRAASPQWAGVASRVRDRLVRPFHLHVANGRGPFTVLSVTPNEVTLGDDDRHLRFRVRCALDARHRAVSVTTEVEYQNAVGRIYFTVVKPFHRLIVARTLARAASRNPG